MLAEALPATYSIISSLYFSNALHPPALSCIISHARNASSRVRSCLSISDELLSYSFATSSRERKSFANDHPIDGAGLPMIKTSSGKFHIFWYTETTRSAALRSDSKSVLWKSKIKSRCGFFCNTPGSSFVIIIAWQANEIIPCLSSVSRGS